MKKLFILILSTIMVAPFAGFVILISSCSNDSSSPSNPNDNQNMVIPLGEEVIGISLAGPLSGKKVFKLDIDINIPNCWNDSVN